MNMAHTLVTISDTVDTVPKHHTVLVWNFHYVKSMIGLMKLGQMILGGICMGIMTYYFSGIYYIWPDLVSTLYFFLVNTTFCIGNFIQFSAGLRTLDTGEILAKSYYEVMYNRFATGTMLAASLNLLMESTFHRNEYDESSVYDLYIVASVIGLVNTILYGINASMAQRRFNAN